MQKIEENHQNYLNFWLNKLQGICDFKIRLEIYEKGISNIKYSFKFWKLYIEELLMFGLQIPIISKFHDFVQEKLENFTQIFSKYPRSWIIQCEYYLSKKDYKNFCDKFFFALNKLSVLQHKKLWLYFLPKLAQQVNIQFYLKFSSKYCVYDPYYIEDIIDVLQKRNEKYLLFQYLKKIVFDKEYICVQKTKFQYSQILVDTIQEIAIEDNKEVENIFYQLIKKYSNLTGSLWINLAHYYMRKSDFKNTRRIFDSALQQIITQKDFIQIYNAYVSFEEQVLQYFLEQLEANSIQKNNEFFDQQDQQILRLENLLQKRQYLLNECNLREFPDNIQYWVQKMNFADDEKTLLSILQQCLLKVNQKQIQGNLSQVWIHVADYYHHQKNYKKMNLIYWNGLQFKFQKNEDLVELYLNWMENLLIINHWEDCLKILKQITDSKQKFAKILKESFQIQLLHQDIYFQYQTLTQNVNYFKCLIDKNQFTVYQVLIFIKYLEENKKYKIILQTVERIIPKINDNTFVELYFLYIQYYIQQNIQNPELIRDMFLKVQKKCAKEKKYIFLYSQFQYEKQLGKKYQALKCLEKIPKCLKENDKIKFMLLHIFQTIKNSGIQQTRILFQNYLEHIQETNKAQFGIFFIKFESKLKEIQRQRQLYKYLSQFCDPNIDQFLMWKEWEHFEIENGNEDTYREYLNFKFEIKNQFNKLPKTLEQIKSQIQQTPENIIENDLKRKQQQLNFKQWIDKYQEFFKVKIKKKFLLNLNLNGDKFVNRIPWLIF